MPVGGDMRRTDIDVLRILLCGAIILVHALAIFAFEPHYHLKSAVPSPAASVLFDVLRAAAISSWFVLAGWSAVVSLRTRSPGRFAKERMQRLIVPLIFGIVIFGSMIKYIELYDGRDMGFHGLREAEWLQGIMQLDRPVGYFDFFPRNLKRLPLMTWSHLWFLAYLFLISILLLPLLSRLARRTPDASVPPAFAVYLPLVPMIAVLVTCNGYWPYFPNLITDWGNFVYFALCVAIGAGIAAWRGFEARLRSEASRFLLLLLIGFIGVAACGESSSGRFFIGLVAWGGAGAGLGFAARLNPAPTQLTDYLSEATLPVYIIHHAPLLLIGWYLLPIAIPVWFKIIVIWLAAIVASLTIYHCLVRPWPWMRWLMGMTPRKASLSVPTAAAVPESI